MSFASSQSQGDKSKKAERQRLRQDVEDLKAILALPAGRRFIWRLLNEASVFKSIWDPSARIHYNAGIQDFGHFIMSEVTSANPDAYFQMMKEAKENEGELNV